MSSPARLDVLIVDDTHLLRQILRRVLTSEGRTSTGVGTTEEALDLLKQGKRPALILLDLHVPELGGRQFLAQLKADPELAMIPVVLMSGDRSGKLPEGVAGVLWKPFDLTDLLHLVGKLAPREPGAST